MVQLAVSPLSMHKGLAPSPAPHKRGLVVHICSPRTWRTREGQARVEFQVIRVSGKGRKEAREGGEKTEIKGAMGRDRDFLPSLKT